MEKVLEGLRIFKNNNVVDHLIFYYRRRRRHDNNIYALTKKQSWVAQNLGVGQGDDDIYVKYSKNTVK